MNCNLWKTLDALLSKRQPLIYSFIHDHRYKLRVAKMCAVFQT